MVYIWIDQFKIRLLEFRHWFRKLFCKSCYLGFSAGSFKKMLQCRETNNSCRYFHCPKRKKCHMNCSISEDSSGETMA